MRLATPNPLHALSLDPLLLEVLLPNGEKSLCSVLHDHALGTVDDGLYCYAHPFQAAMDSPIAFF